MRARRALAGWLAAPLLAAAQQPACPEPHEVGPDRMLGLWRAEFVGRAGATLLLEQHPAYALSFAGGINRNGERGQVVGDMEDGELTLEESADGERIAATWLGDVVPGSCGREIRGGWQARGSSDWIPFVLRKLER